MLNGFGFHLHEEMFNFILMLLKLIKKFHCHTLTKAINFSEGLANKFEAINICIKTIYHFELLNIYEMKEILEIMKKLLKEKMELVEEDHYVKWLKIGGEVF